MNGPYIIGVDQGTQSTKTVILDSCGSCVAEASRPVSLFTPQPGWVEQDPEEIYRSVLVSIRDAVVQAAVEPTEIACIAVDSQVCSMVPVDQDMQPVGPVISHLDSRSELERDHQLQCCGERIRSQNGHNPYIAPRLAWMEKHDPSSFNRVRKALLVNAYVSGRMASLPLEESYVDRTCMNVYGWGNVLDESWDSELAQALQVDPEMAPGIVDPETVIGGLSREAADACGLISGIPVAAGCGDAIAGWIGAGAVQPGILVDTAGTANHLGFCMDSFQPDMSHGVLSHFPSAIRGQWYAIGFMAGVGRTHSWFADELYAGRTGSGAADFERSRGDVFRELDSDASTVPPGSEGLLFSPHFGGRMCPYQPNTVGGWVGLTWKHNRSHMYRALLESVALEYDMYLSTARRLYPDLDFVEIYGIGGGTRSALWNQIKSDVLGLPYRVLQRSDFAPVGAALIAGCAVQVFEDLAETARSLQSVSQNTHPRQAVHEDYRKISRLYSQLWEAMAPVFTSLAGGDFQGEE